VPVVVDLVDDGVPHRVRIVLRAPQD